LTRRKIAFEVQTESGGGGLASPDEKRQQFEAINQRSYQDPKRIEPRLRTSIVDSISIPQDKPRKSFNGHAVRAASAPSRRISQSEPA
jgi:hypothetical protein